MINNFNILAVCFMFYFITCTNRIIDTVNAQPPDGDKKDTANAQTSVGDKNVIKENYKKLSNNVQETTVTQRQEKEETSLDLSWTKFTKFRARDGKDLSELGLSNMTIDDSEVHQTSKKLREQFNTLLNQENHKLTTKLKTYLTKENNINIYESDGNSILNTLKKYNELNLSGIQDVNFRSDFNNLVKIATSLKLIENLAEENINVEKLNHCVYEFKNRGFLNNRTYTAMSNIAVKIYEYEFKAGTREKKQRSVLLRGCHTRMRCHRLTNVEHRKKCTCAGQLFSLSIYNRIIRISQRIGNVTDFPCKRVCVVSKKYPKDKLKKHGLLGKLIVDYIKEYNGNYPDPFEYCIDHSNKK